MRNTAPGVFAFAIGTQSCVGSVACLFTDDWFPSGYLGGGVQAGVTTIGVYRTQLGYNTQGNVQPINEFATGKSKYKSNPHMLTIS